MTIDRRIPTTSTYPTPPGISGEDFSEEVQEEIGALWDTGSVWLTSVSGVDDIVADCIPAVTSYVRGQSYWLPPAGSNTTPDVRLRISGLPFKDVVDASGNALTVGVLNGTMIHRVVYDGTKFRVMEGPSVGFLDITWTGAWLESFIYGENEGVDYDGFIYVSRVDGNLGNEPSGASDAFWQLFGVAPTTSVVSDIGDALRTLSSRFADRPDIRDKASINGVGGNDDSTDFNALLEEATNAGQALHIPAHFVIGFGGSMIVPDGAEIDGGGSGQYPMGSDFELAQFLALPKTTLKCLPGFPAGEPLISAETLPGADYTLHGIKMRGLYIYGAGIPDVLLQVRGIKHCRFEDLLLAKPREDAPSAPTKYSAIIEDTLPGGHEGTTPTAGTTTTAFLQDSRRARRSGRYVNSEIEITSGPATGDVRTINNYNGTTGQVTVSVAFTAAIGAGVTYDLRTQGPTLTPNSANQFNSWRGITCWVGGFANAWVFRGDTQHDSNTNIYDLIKIVNDDGDGIDLEVADNNTFVKVDTFTFGLGYGVRFRGSNHGNGEFARHNHFHDLQVAGPGTSGILFMDGSTQPAQYNHVNYNCGNSPPAPVFEAGAERNRVYVNTANTGIGWRDWTPSITFDTPGSLSPGYSVRLARYTLTPTTVKYVVWLTFTPTLGTASGDFKITGLPDTLPAAGVTSGYGGVVHGSSNILFGAGRTQVSARVMAGTTDIKLVVQGSGTSSLFCNTAHFQSGVATIIQISGEYEVEG